MGYKCSACNEDIDSDLLVYIKHTEKHIVDEIKLSHPEWVEDDGICRKCVDYFKGQIKGGSSEQ
jgi:hypothetical protein